MRKPHRHRHDRPRPAATRGDAPIPAPVAPRVLDIRVAPAPPPPWYSGGLQFGCTGCGACCRAGRYVWLGTSDVARLAEHLGLSVETFRERYTRAVVIPGEAEPGVHLIKAPHGCVFLDDATNGCTVYPARPTQCQTFPFWPRALETPEDWQRDVVALCGPEAVGQGHVYTVEEIGVISARIHGSGPAPLST